MANRNLKGDVNVQFEEPTSRINLDSGSSVKTLFGRISKWLKDLKAVAFSGSYTDLSDKPTIPPATAVKGNSETTYRTGNVNLTPANIGLGNVNNTSDANKPISTAAQAALNGKVNKSGDTMTGFLTHKASNVYLKATNLDLNGDNPSAFTWGNSEINFADKDGQRACFFNVGRGNTGCTKVSIAAQARNTADTGDVYNEFGIRVERDGTRSYLVADPAAFRSAISAASKAQVNYNTNNGVKNLLSTEWFVTDPNAPQSATVESYDVETGSITGFASASLTNPRLTININVGKMNNVLENGKTYILSWTVDSMETNTGILGMRRADDNSYSVGGAAYITRTGNYSVSYTHNSSIPVFFSLCVNTTGLSTDKRIAISSLMLREATIEDDTFEPYAEPNYQLTQKVDKALEQTGYNLLEITANTQTINGVTFTVDKAAGTITANGTANQLTFFAFKLQINDGKYILTGCPPTGSDSTYRLDIRDNSGGTTFTDALDYGTGSGEITLSGNKYLNIRIVSGYNCNNLVFRPMIVPAELAGVPFQPYAKSNAELTADIPLTIHIDYRNIDVPTCDSTYNECLSALESGRAVIAMIQITSKLMRTCFFGLDADTKIICGEIPNGNTTYDFDWRAGEDCPSIGISS